jgi:hypothetical protein
MGCGLTLRVDSCGLVYCSASACRDAHAVDKILSDPDIDQHIAVLYEETFSVQHPLRERVSGELFNCTLHKWLRDLECPPVDPGKYRVVEDPRGSRAHPYIFELIELIGGE